MRVYHAFKIGNTTLSDGEHTPAFDISELQNKLQGFDCYDQGAKDQAKLRNKLERIAILQICFPNFIITHIP